MSMRSFKQFLHHSKMKRDVYSRKLMIHVSNIIEDRVFKQFFISPFNIFQFTFHKKKNCLIKIISNYSSDRQPSVIHITLSLCEYMNTKRNQMKRNLR